MTDEIPNADDLEDGDTLHDNDLDREVAIIKPSPQFAPSVAPTGPTGNPIKGRKETLSTDELQTRLDDGRYEPTNIESETDADEDEDELSWTTKRGADVTVRARDGKLYMDLDAEDATLEDESTNLTREKGTDVLYAGRHEDDNGDEFEAFVPLTSSKKREIETMKEETEPEREYSEDVKKAFEEAERKDEKVEIDTQRVPCNEPSEECNLDRMTRYATPDGEIETSRVHTR